MVSEKFKKIEKKEEDKLINKKKRPNYQIPSITAEKNLAQSQVSAYKAQANYLILFHGLLVGILLLYCIVLTIGKAVESYIPLYQKLIMALVKLMALLGFVCSTIPFSMIFTSKNTTTSICFIIVSIINVAGYMVIIAPVSRIISVYYSLAIVDGSLENVSVEILQNSLNTYTTYIYCATALYICSYILEIFSYVLPTMDDTPQSSQNRDDTLSQHSTQVA